MSAKAWWTLGILAAPFLYVLTFPPLYHLSRHGTHRLMSSAPYTHPRSSTDIWMERLNVALGDLLDLYEVPYWALAEYPPFEIYFLGYDAFWRERI